MVKKHNNLKEKFLKIPSLGGVFLKIFENQSVTLRMCTIRLFRSY